MSTPILVVDDETNIRKVLKALLEQEGYQVSEAKDGIEALSLLKKESFQTIITDLRMPQLDGMGLLEASLKHYPDIPIIIVTAHGTVDSAVSALKMGAFDYISKPFDKTEMIQVIKKALNTYQTKSKITIIYLSMQQVPSQVQLKMEMINHELPSPFVFG